MGGRVSVCTLLCHVASAWQGHVAPVLVLCCFRIVVLDVLIVMVLVGLCLFLCPWLLELSRPGWIPLFLSVDPFLTDTSI